MIIKTPPQPHPALDPHGYSFLIRSTIFRPVSILMLFIATLVVGAMTYRRVPLQLLPQGLSGGEVGVYIPVPDGTPQENMELIAKPAEDLLRTLPGLRSVVTNSGARRVKIQLEFDPRYEISWLVADIRDRMERAKPSWPEGVERYHLWRQNEAEIPTYITSLGLVVDPASKQKFRVEGVEDFIYDEIIRTRLESVQGVARVNIWGLTSQSIEIALRKDEVAGYGVDLRELVDRMSKDNRSINAGIIRDGDRELLVRVDSQFDDFSQILDFPVNQNMTLGEFAEVRRRRALRDNWSRVNGSHAKAVVIHKESGANAVEVCQRVSDEIGRLEADLKRTVPGVNGVVTQSWFNQGEQIEASIDSLRENALLGGLFAVIVLFAFFRRLGMTALVTLAIPFSLLMTVVWIYFCGGSFNILSLMGLSLGIGMLVDNSIVVVENILRRIERGEAAIAAAIGSIREVGLAVSLATLTTVMVFLPLIFVTHPQIKVMTQEIGLPLCISVLASLVVALVFIPQGAIVLDRNSKRPQAERATSAGATGDAPKAKEASRLNRLTVRSVAWALSHRGAAFLIVTALLASTGTAWQQAGKEAMNMEGPERFQARVEMPKNFTLREADEHYAIIEAAIAKGGEQFGIRSINSWFDSQNGQINIFLEPGRRVKQADFYAAIRPHLPDLPGVSIRLGFEQFDGGGANQRMMLYVEANHFEGLDATASLVEDAMRESARFPYLKEVSRWREDELEEVRVAVDRRSATHRGIDTARVSMMVAWALRGSQLPDFVDDDRELPLWIRYDDADKESIDELGEVYVWNDRGKAIPLSNLASLEMVAGSGDIHRRQGKMTVGISARVEGISVAEARARVEHELKTLVEKNECELAFSQRSGDFNEDFKVVLTAISMALLLVFFVMGLLFESWILPLSILLSIPFAFFGSLWLLVATNTSLDAVGAIGGLMLIGIVVNNAIVLVDSINRHRVGGLPRHEAILQAVRVRFRPIWMTALTTIFGLLPLAVLEQRGEGVDYKSLAIVLIGGLATSTFFTLFVVPLLYSTLDDVRRVARTMIRGVP